MSEKYCFLSEEFINLTLCYVCKVMYIFRVRVGKRGVIVIPKEIRDSLGIKEGMVLELEVREDKIILKTKDLWSILRERGRKISFNIDEAEREIDMEEEEWLRRFQQ